jgi:DNA-binding transcriptional regulator YiaG|tara:strand:- start:9363 stop:9560 length:198 start_codon:yes stop_codon:yes gene_type:complete
MKNPTKEMIKNRRRDSKLTQQQMADMVKVSLDAVKKWESGDRKMSASTWHLVDILTTEKCVHCNK